MFRSLPGLSVLGSMFLFTVLLNLSAADSSPPLRTDDHFAIPQLGHRFEFPRDHGSHPDFKIEWWYITGHLFAPDDRRFGFQATFFRIAGPQSSGPPAGNTSPLFGHSELHLAHMALLDVKQARFIHQERLNRAGWDARASTHTLSVRNGNWSLQLATNTPAFQLLLHGSIHADADFAFTLTPAKPLVIFGTNSVSRKGADLSAASYYLTFSRLHLSGLLNLGGRPQAVHGEAWMDHEISSSQLAADQAGWDWASLQLKDGREIMAYRMRKKDGTTDPFSTLAWIDRQGAVTHLSASQFTWTVERTWQSPATGGTYPIRGTLRTTDPATGHPVTFTLAPLYPAQELTGALGGVPYWEGACQVLDPSGTEIGSAYVELTGYAGTFSGSLR